MSKRFILHHRNPRYLHHELHNQETLGGKIMQSIREIVFGLQDGIVSTLGAITGIAAGTLDSRVVILSGCVVIVVESLSMAAGTFLSSKSEREAQQRMLKEEEEEIERFPEAERQELIEFYKERGFTEEEVRILVNRITSNKKLWLEEMAHKELGIFLEEKDTPKKDAIFMGFSYIVGGIIPLAMYFLLPIKTALATSVLFSVAMLFIVGYVKGHLVYANKVRSGIEMMIVSLVAAGLGYAVGRIIASVFGIDV